MARKSKTNAVGAYHVNEFQLFFDLPFTGNAIIDANHNWLIINNELLRILNLECDRTPEKKWHQFIHKQYEIGDKEIFDRVAKNEIQKFSFETLLTREDGITIACLISIAQIPSKDDEKKIGFQLVDITGQKQAEDNLKRSASTAQRNLEELEWIYSNAPIGLCYLDIDLRYKRINRFLANINGLPPNAHIGRRINDIVKGSGVAIEQITDAILSTGKPVTQEISRVPKRTSDPPRYFNEHWYPLFDEKKNIIGFGAVIEEVTEKKHITALQSADRRKNELLATLAHELRNPIGSVSAALELMRIIDEQDNAAPKRDRAPLERAERQIGHMKQLVEDILTVSRITQGKIVLRKNISDITATVWESIETTKEKMNIKSLSLITDIPTQPVMIAYDPLRLMQIITNLLDNAVKFTNAGGKIHVSVLEEAGELIIIVKDDGIGIENKKIESIFEIFNQINTAPGRKNEGVGIGLALVRNLVELHNGRVEVRSDGVGKGATFIIRLPK